MHAVQFEDLGMVSFVEVPDPQLGPQQVLIRCVASGLCHTDIDILHGRYGGSRFPLIPGHEYAGVVVETGAEVTDLRIGDRVVVDPNIACGECRYCSTGRYNLCVSLGAYGVTENGGFSELSAVSFRNVVKIGSLPFRRAALAEPLGCVLNGLHAIAHVPSSSAVIFGAGPMGILLGLALRARSKTEVTMVDKDDSKLSFASAFGFEAVAAESASIARSRHSFDLAIDATGVPAVARSLTEYVANGGGVLFFGVCPPADTIALSPFEVFRRQLTLAGSHSLNRNIPESIELIKELGPQLDRLVSHRLPLSEIPAAMQGSLGKGTLKIQAGEF